MFVRILERGRMAGGIFAFPRFSPVGEEEGMGAGRYTRLVFRERSTDTLGEGKKIVVLVPTLKIVRKPFVFTNGFLNLLHPSKTYEFNLVAILNKTRLPLEPRREIFGFRRC